MLRPTVLFLIGIILIALSLSFWYFVISPMCSLATYNPPTLTKAKNTTQTSATVYFGTVYHVQSYIYNWSHPVDYSFNVSFWVEVTKGGPIEVLVYVRDRPVWGPEQTSDTVKIIKCNSTLYNSTNPSAGVFPNVAGDIPVSLLDAFTGGTTPYMVIRNLNTNSSTNFSYGFSYTALHRSGNGVTMVMFFIGVIIAIVEGVVLVKFLIRRIRQR
jgi:hypothetical protein